MDFMLCLFGAKSFPKSGGMKLFVFPLCPILGKSLKGDKACQRRSFHMLPLSARIWHLPVTSVQAEEGSDNQTEPLQPLSLSGAQIFWRWIGKTVLWNTEIASAASEEARLSAVYQESDCDNEVIKRWRWGIPANGEQHPVAGHLLRQRWVLIVWLISEGSGQLGLLCLMSVALLSFHIESVLQECLAAVEAEWLMGNVGGRKLFWC